MRSPAVRCIHGPETGFSVVFLGRPLFVDSRSAPVAVHTAPGAVGRVVGATTDACGVVVVMVVPGRSRWNDLLAVVVLGFWVSEAHAGQMFSG